VTDGLLLIHAFPLDASMWDGQVETFADRLPVVAPHLPGFGGTAPAGDVMTMRQAAERCIEELDTAGVQRAVVCGLSMGGYVAFELWRMARGRIIGLVLANTRAEPDAPEGAAKRRDLAARLLAEGSAFLVEAPPPLLSDAAPGELRQRVRSVIAAQAASAIAAASLGMAERPDSTPELETIDVPALIITSSDDTLIPPEITSPMAGRISGASLEVIEGAGHLSNLEAPARFDALIETHLSACGVGS
jgi:3-oxoadipate enol-lactonase